MSQRSASPSDEWGLRQGSWRLFALTYLLATSSSTFAGGFQAFSPAWWGMWLLPLVLGALFIASPWLPKLWPRGRIEARARIYRAESCKGLVVLVSPGKGSESAAKAIEYHQATLARAWLVHSDTSREAATALLERLSQRVEFSQGTFCPLHLSDAEFDNPGLVQELIERKVFEQLPEGIGESEVVVDITGGMKGTSAGAFLAGLPQGRRLEYVSPAATDTRGRGTRPGQPIEIGIDYKLKRVRSR